MHKLAQGKLTYKEAITIDTQTNRIQYVTTRTITVKPRNNEKLKFSRATRDRRDEYEESHTQYSRGREGRV